MKRRDFLRYGIGLSLISSSLYSLANTMGQMKHHHAMMGMQTQVSLMPLDKLPSQQPLITTLPKLKNLSKQAGVFKAKLVAEPTTIKLAGDQPTEFWAYNGQLPGPQIEVFEGDEVEIEFVNHLPQPTTIHWHGLDVHSGADGNPQDPVAPNSRRIYRFTIPEGSAGTYWYHPHPHGYVSEQVYKGLAGTLVVKAKQDPLSQLDEQHWVISDLRLTEDGKIPANSMTDWMNGREGEIVLINGQYQPKIKVQQQRIRIWNATSARYLRLKVAGVQWVVLGTEGGLLEKALAPQDELFLAPAERVEVMMIGDTQGEAVLQSLYYERHKMMVQEPAMDLTLAQIEVKAEPITLPEKLRTLPTQEPAKVVRQVRFSEQMMNHEAMSPKDHHKLMMAHSTEHSMDTDNPVPAMMEGVFLINGKSFAMDRVDFVGKVDQVEQWEIFNESHMDHPFHLHGTQFEVIQTTLNGKTKPAPYRALKDVVNLRPYEKVLIRFKQRHTGLKMFHCHILEHENLGMMGQLKVE